MAAALEAGVSRLFRLGGAHAVAALAYGTAHRAAAWTRSSGRATAAWRRRRRSSRPTAASTSTPAHRDRHRRRRRAGRLDRRRSDRAGRARSRTRARCSITPSRTLAERVVAPRSTARMPADGPARASIRAHGGVIVTASLPEAIDARQRRGAPSTWSWTTTAMAAQVRSAGSLFVGPLVGAGRGRLRDRLEPRRCRRRAPLACAAACRPRISSGRSPCSELTRAGSARDRRQR